MKHSLRGSPAGDPDRSIMLLGLGIAIPTQTDRRTVAELQRADIVFHALAGPIETAWLRKVRPDAVSLVPLYSKHQERFHVYSSMAEQVVQAAIEQRRTAVAFYGHPIISCTISQLIQQLARAHKISVSALPAISSIDCLFADIGFDPALEGALIIDASKFIQRNYSSVQNEVSLVLLQIGLTGNYAVPSFVDPLRPPSLGRIVDLLSRLHSPDHYVLLYEAPVHLTLEPRVAWCPVKELPSQVLTLATTLFVPSAAWSRANIGDDVHGSMSVYSTADVPSHANDTERESGK